MPRHVIPTICAHDVLLEVIDVFPFEFVHIGGDEAPKAQWRACPEAQAVMAREGLRDEEELQAHVVGRVGAFLAAHGRRMVGWDEILAGGGLERTPPGAVVMSWQGLAGGAKAAAAGRDVVMCPTSHCYFDFYQGEPATEPLAIHGLTTLRDVFCGFDPTARGTVPPEAAHRVLGSQGNVWTEYIRDEKHCEYMAWPRMCALAEVLWSPPPASGGNRGGGAGCEERDFADFERRLSSFHLQRLRALGANYRPLGPDTGPPATDSASGVTG
eukprot:g3700.t1